jgi:hypothetical protein
MYQLAVFFFCLPWRNEAPSRSLHPYYWEFMITLRHTTIGRAALDE